MDLIVIAFFIFFLLSFIVAVFRFLLDLSRYPILAKVLKKNIKMFKQYQKQYKKMLKDLEKEKKRLGGDFNEST